MTAPDIEDIYPLTPTQQGMLFHAATPDGETFVERLSVTLRGDVDVPALRAAWQTMVDRHPVLRTAVIWEGMDTPLQVVAPSARLPWTERSAADPDQPEADRPDEPGFTLASPPLLRVELTTYPDSRYRMRCAFHHMLLDGWSLSMLLDELAATYRGTVTGHRAPVTRRRPFRDYAAWLAGLDHAASERYWRPILAGFTEPTPIRIDQGGRAGRRGHVRGYGEHEFTVPGSVGTRLAELARAHQVTLNTVVEGAWAVLLAAYSGRRDVLFGVTTSGRSAPLRGIDTMLGMFINALPARVATPPERDVWDWLVDVRSDQVGRAEHEAVPPLTMRDWSDLPRGVPLFDTALVFENYPTGGEPAAWGERVEVESVRYQGGRANYPLTVFAFPGTPLTLRAVYDADRFDPDSIAALGRHVNRVLAGFADGGPLGAVSPLDPAERLLLSDWSTPATRYPRDALVPDLVAARAREAPDDIACALGNTTLTYGELHRRARALSTVLRGTG